MKKDATDKRILSLSRRFLIRRWMREHVEYGVIAVIILAILIATR